MGKYHSLGHFLAFVAVGFVLARTVHSMWGRVVAFAGAIVFGLGIEVMEHLAFGNALEWKDVLVDAAGAIAGTLLAMASAGEADLTAEADL